MLDSIRYNFAHLFDFSGRDARPTFWFWVLFVFILNIIGSMIISVPAMVGAMSTAMEAARSGADQTAVQAAMTAQMSGMVGSMVTVSVVIGVINLVLLAASLVRRLHDSGKPGVWAAAIGAIYAVSLVVSYRQIAQMQAMMSQLTTSSPQEVIELQRNAGMISLLGWLPLILLAVFGIMKSDVGANRYGEEPHRR